MLTWTNGAVCEGDFMNGLKHERASIVGRMENSANHSLSITKPCLFF